MENISYERRVYESVDDITAYLRLYLKDHGKKNSCNKGLIYYSYLFINLINSYFSVNLINSYFFVNLINSYFFVNLINSYFFINFIHSLILY